MPKVGSSTDDGAGGVPRPAEPAARVSGRLLQRLGWSAVVAGVAAVGVLGFGFLWFVWRVPADEVALHRNADGIVALTGGASRVADAMELMAAGRGKRLLISGAYRTTTPGEISRLNPVYARVAGCCVDFDNSLNTLGNAIETRRWAERWGFR
ncbi:MAG TPA: YdcF family protein, partial [Xanthobacteraceae bacterium]|nr:YdcF family protein [Xanthobacteraceae bacterium]